MADATSPRPTPCTESYVSWLLDGEPDDDGERAATYAQWGFADAD